MSASKKPRKRVLHELSDSDDDELPALPDVLDTKTGPKNVSLKNVSRKFQRYI